MKRIFDATDNDRILEAQIDAIDFFRAAMEDERRSMRFLAGHILTAAALFAVALAFWMLVIFPEDVILRNFYAFWRAIV